MLSFKAYLAALAQANGLNNEDKEVKEDKGRQAEEIEWLFYPGMLQDNCSKWWADFGTRATCHEGIDICFYRTGKGPALPLPPGATVPAMAKGTVLNISADLLGKSIVVSLSQEVHQAGYLEPDQQLYQQVDGQQVAQQVDQEIVMVYSHLDVAQGLLQGDAVDSGMVIGRTFDTRIKQSKLRSHLHLSCICLPKGLTADQLNWDLFADRNRVFHLNPIFVGQDGK